MSSIRPPAPSQSASLTIQRHGEDVLCFSMNHLRWVQEDIRKVSKKRREQIRQLLYDFEELDKGELEDIDKLQSIGEWLFLNLLPKVFQREIKKLSQPLTIRTNDPTIPWELLHDTTEFLALKTPIARQLILKSAMGPISSILDEMVNVEVPFRSLLIADPGEDLPMAKKEGEALLQVLKSKGPCDFLCGRQATHEEVIHLLRRNVYTVIHFAGHVDYDKEDRTSFIRFRDGRMIAADEVGRIVKGCPIVFLNACMADFRNEDEISSQSGTSMRATESFAEAFMLPNEEGMALAVVGTIWKVPDLEAVSDLSRTFYEHLFAGYSLGESMLNSRLHARDNGQGPMVWAPYVLYGDPCWIPFTKEEGKEKSKQKKKKNSVKPDRRALMVLFALFKALSKSEMKFLISLHILVALCRAGSHVLVQAAQLCRTRIDDVQKSAEIAVEQLVEDLKKRTQESPDVMQSFGLSDSVSDVFKGARLRAISEGRSKFSDDDLLYCLVRRDESSASSLLRDCGIRLEIVQALIRGDEIRRASDGGNEPEARIQSLAKNLTKGVENGVAEAFIIAERSGGGKMSTGHLLAGLIRSGSVAATVILAKGGVIDDMNLAKQIEARLMEFERGTSLAKSHNREVSGISNDVLAIFERAGDMALKIGLAKIDDGMLVSEILADQSGVTLEQVVECGGDLEKLRTAANEFLSRQEIN